MHSNSSLQGSIVQYLPAFTNSAQTKDQLASLTESWNSVLATTASKIGEIKTNLIYSIKHSDLAPLSRKEIELTLGGSSARLFGQEYTAEQAYKFLFAFRTTFWLTYRKGIKQIQTDNGWGCMIRAVQMVFAEVLKRHLTLKNTESDQYQIIRHFSEQSDGVLSLSAICEEGHINKRWTSALEIFTHFKSIMKRYPSHYSFYFEVYSSGVSFKQGSQMLLPSYPALVSLSSRVSLESIPEEFHCHYFQMMGHRSWVGSVGGLDGQALYIIGSYENKVIFLDPHKVQSNEEELETETYFCKTPRGIELSALSPSLSFCYYFKTKEEHLEWIEWISKICERCYPNLIFEFMKESDLKRLKKTTENGDESSLEQIWFENEEKQLMGEVELEIVSGENENSDDFEVLE